MFVPTAVLLAFAVALLVSASANIFAGAVLLIGERLMPTSGTFGPNNSRMRRLRTFLIAVGSVLLIAGVVAVVLVLIG